jgi:hypothetical protein
MSTTETWNPSVLQEVVNTPAPPGLPVDQQGISERKAGLSKSLVTAAELAKAEVPPRESIVSPFFCVGDLGFVFGVRGEGKSWIGMMLALAISNGRALPCWDVTKSRRVLLVDGEMPLETLKSRQCLLGSAPEDLLFLQHELHYERTGQSLDLADPSTQEALTAVVQENGVEVLILDNLSCLFFGMRENEADSWEYVLPWLLRMRCLGVAVVIVAHAGRNGEMRGTSKREDQAFWVMKVTKTEMPDGEAGTRFRTHFTKNRNALDVDCPPIEWTLRPSEAGLAVTAHPVTNEFSVLNLIAAGVTSASDLGEELNLTKGRISQIASTLRQRGLIEVRSRQYEITEAGRSRLERTTVGARP